MFLCHIGFSGPVRNHERRDNICKYACAGEQGNDRPQKTNHGGVHTYVLRNTCAYTGNLSVGCRSVKFLFHNTYRFRLIEFLSQ